jgi:hypothetical protein
MRWLVAALIALALAPVAGAKGKMTMSLGDSTPAVAQAVTVALKMEFALDADAKVMVIAVAPGKNMYDLMSRFTNPADPANASVRVPRDGFAVDLARLGPHRWRAFVRFPRPGRWRLVVPNWGGAPGYAMPPPIVRMVTVN